jgi:predicted 2-oxoglutarate/Fe(II)-dependent dioxygenase YbiX
LLRALLDFLSDNSLDSQIKALESLKSCNKDWQSIDEKINELYQSKLDKNFLTQNINQVKKIKMFLETYQNDDIFDDILEKYVSRISDNQEAYVRGTIPAKMSKDNDSNYSSEKLLKISDKFLQRAKDLEF